TAPHLPGNFAGNVGNLEFFDSLDAAVAGKQSSPSFFSPAGERRHQTESCDHHASHRGHSRRTQPTPAAYGDMRRSQQSTSLMQKIPAGCRSALCVLFEKFYGVTHRQNRLGGIVGNFAAELFLKSHDQLDRIETVGAEVI